MRRAKYARWSRANTCHWAWYEMCDCMLLIGTSAVVYPAASFPEEVKRHGGTLIEVNPNETPLSEASNVILRGAAGEVLPKVMARAKEFAA